MVRFDRICPRLSRSVCRDEFELLEGEKMARVVARHPRFLIARIDRKRRETKMARSATFVFQAGRERKRKVNLLVKITRSTCTSNGMNISWRSNSKIRQVSWKGVYPRPRITVSSWSSFGEFHGVVGCVRLKARSVRGGAGGTRLHAIGIVVATLYVSLSTVTPKPGHYAFIRANYTRYITLQRRLFPVSSYYARARLFLPLFFSTVFDREGVWLVPRWNNSFRNRIQLLR